MVPGQLAAQPALATSPARQAQLAALHKQDAALAQEKKNLSDAGEIGRIAREQYQLVDPGQQAYEVLPPSGAAAAGTPYAGDPGSAGPATPSATPELPPGGVTTTTTPAGHAAHAHDAGPAAGVGPAGAHAARARVLALTARRRMDDDEAVAALLGRDPGGNFVVVVRGPDGAPMVIENEPFLRDGTPMPTRYWLVDPELRARGRPAGGVRAASAKRSARWIAAAARRMPPPLRGGARRADPAGADGATAERRGGRHARRASSASMPIWPGGWRAATTRSAPGRRQRLGLTRPEE